MKLGIATIARTFGSHYEFAASLPEGNFLISNGDEELTNDDYGKPVLVQYDPQDQFCQVVPLNVVDQALKAIGFKRPAKP